MSTTILKTSTGVPMQHSNLEQSFREQYDMVVAHKGSSEGVIIHKDAKDNPELEIDLELHQKDAIYAALIAIFGGKGERTDGSVLWLAENKDELPYMEGFSFDVVPKEGSRVGAKRYKITWEQVMEYITAIHPVIDWAVTNHPLESKAKAKKDDESVERVDLSTWS